VTKLETILETKSFLVSKLVSIIVRWFLNWYLISNQGFCYMYRPVLGRRWLLVMVGHVSWVPQAAWISVSRATRAQVPKSGQTSITKMYWCVLNNRVRAMRHWTLVTQTTELGHERWILDNTPVISREKPKSRGVHACGLNSAFRRSTSKEPLEALRPMRVTFQG